MTKTVLRDNPIAAFNIGEELNRHYTESEQGDLQAIIDDAEHLVLDDPTTGAKIGISYFDSFAMNGPDILVPLPLRAGRTTPERLLEGAEIARALGARVITAEAHGYGGSTTSLRLARQIAVGNFREPAQSIHDTIEASDFRGFGKNGLTIFGESLGGVIAANYAAQFAVSKLVLFESGSLYDLPARQFSALNRLRQDGKLGSAFRKQERLPHALNGLRFPTANPSHVSPVNNLLMLMPGFGMGTGFDALRGGLARNPGMSARIISAGSGKPFEADVIKRQIDRLRNQFGDRVSFASLPGEVHSTAPFYFRRIADHIGDAIAKNN